MKTNILKLTTITIALLIVFSACKKDSRTAPQASIITTHTPSSVNQPFMQGFWRVGSFIDNSIDKTDHYDGFAIHFDTTGTVTAANTNTVFTGSWAISNNNNQLQLVLSFVNQGTFTDLTHNWVIIQTSDTQIKLADTTNGNTDYLTLNENLIK